MPRRSTQGCEDDQVRGIVLTHHFSALVRVMLLAAFILPKHASGDTEPRNFPLVRTPSEVTVNRTVPVHSPVSETPQIADNPSDAEILGLRLLPQPIVRSEKPKPSLLG